MTAWTVVQPAATPEMTHLATALARHGSLETYISSTPFTRDSIWASKIVQGVTPKLSRRLLPSPITREMVVSSGTLTEFAFKALHGKPYLRTQQLQLMHKRAKDVHRRAQAVLSHRGDGTGRGIVVQAGRGWRTLELARSKGYQTVLNTSIVHRRFMADEIRREIERYPDWADGMLEYIRPEVELDELDRELEIAHVVLAQSRFQAKVLREYGVDPGKIQVIPLGVDEAFHQAQTSKMVRNKKDGNLRIGWLGQVTQRKGFVDLLSALGNDFQSRGYTLVVAGVVEGNVVNRLRAVGAELCGPIAHSEVTGWLQGVDILVSPSLLEGFSLAPVEAMAAGVPVLVSDRLYVSDLITTGHNGWLVEARNCVDLRERLEHIRKLSSEDLGAVGRAGAELVASLRWDTYEARIADLLCQC